MPGNMEWNRGFFRLFLMGSVSVESVFETVGVAIFLKIAPGVTGLCDEQ